MRRLAQLAIVILLVAVIVGVSAGTVSANEEFGLQTDTEIETPDRTVDHSYVGEHTISSIGVTEADGSLSVDVTAPSEDTHQLELRHGEDPASSLEDSEDIRDGSETVSLSVNEPGSYVLLLQSGGSTKTMLPVVVSGYDVDAAYDETDGELTVGATVDPTASNGEPSEVEAVVWDDDTRERQTLTQQSGEEYESTLSLDEFDNEYQVYVAALGDATLDTTGESEILGIGEADSGLDISDGDDGDDDNGNDDSSNNDNGGQDGQGVPVDSSTDDVDDVDDGENDDNEDDSDESVIQPNESDDTDEDTEAETDGSDDDNEDTEGDEQIDDEIPLSPAVAIIAILTAGIVLSRKK